jgi:hypothetical protein
VNPRARRAALYAIGLIAILASGNALAHSYVGLYGWAIHHRLSGWQAKSWPAEIDVFLAVGELALYVAYLDGWPARQRIWPWMTALTGLAVRIGCADQRYFGNPDYRYAAWSWFYTSARTKRCTDLFENDAHRRSLGWLSSTLFERNHR